MAKCKLDKKASWIQTEVIEAQNHYGFDVARNEPKLKASVQGAREER